MNPYCTSYSVTCFSLTECRTHYFITAELHYNGYITFYSMDTSYLTTSDWWASTVFSCLLLNASMSTQEGQYRMVVESIYSQVRLLSLKP